VGVLQMYQAINNVLMSLNKAGSVFCSYAAGIFIQTALLVILLFIIDLLLRKKIRAIFRYCLWLLVLVKLILPPMFSLPTGIGYWVGDHIPTAPSISNMTFDVVAFEHTGPSNEIPHVSPVENVAGDDPAMAPVGSALTALTWQAVVFLFWLAGILGFLVVLIQRIRFVRGLIMASCPAGDDLTGLLKECRRQMAVRREIKLRLSEAIPSPAVCGLLRPTVLMPTSLIERLSPEGLRATLIHELAHIKRGDLWVNSVQTFLQVVYFYNPFVWFANSVIRKVCEEAVDETVLVALGGQAEGYSNTLIDIGEMVFWKADFGLRLIGVAESKKALQWRIRHMLNRPIPKSSKLGLIGITMLLIIAAILLPMARAQKADEKTKPVSSDNKEEYTRLLHQAAAAGDIEQVKLLISKGADVNERDSCGKTPLHYACEKGHTEVAKMIISRGADVNAVSSERRMNPDWRKPLDYAAMGGYKQTVELLISKGADINAQSEGGRRLWFEAMRSRAVGGKEVVKLLVARGAEIPALHLAAYMGDMEKLKKLLQEGKNVNEPATYGFTALHAATNGGNKDVVEFLISKGAKVDARDTFRLTPLYYAALHSYEDIVDLLVDKGSDINADDDGWTLLYNAILYDYYGDKGKDAVKLIISKGANVNVKDSAGCTPLHYAIWMDYGDIVETLINNGADVNAEDNDGFTPYCCAVMRGRKDFVELLIAKGATPVSTIHWAAAAGDLEKVKAFIEEGTDIDAEDKSGETPLFSAVRADNSEVAKFLIAKGANVNAKDSSGNTPLHFAPERAKKDVVELLIVKGANINAKSKNGETPLHAAIYYGRREIAELFIAKGADVNAKHTHHSISGITPLYIACSRGYKDVAEALLAKSADINTKDSNGQTPLYLACVPGHKDIVQLLITKVADINAKDNNGQTALSLALEKGHTEVAELLHQNGAEE